jgi:hypothetical protein
MIYNFFADKSDKIEILNFIFNETDFQLFDLASDYGQQISKYENIDTITSKFSLKEESLITFQLWSPRFKANPIFRKIELNPKRCNGHTFRYATEGWGLIQLYFGGLKQSNLNGELQTRLHKSHIGHFNQKGALTRENGNLGYGKANMWNWKEIEKTSRQLKYHINNRLAVKTLGSFGVLREAEILERSGVIFSQ